jgi:putative oxidoreductase
MYKALLRPVPHGHPVPPVLSDLASLLLRVGLAAIFLFHGLDKICAAGNEWGTNWLATMMNTPPKTVEHTPFLTGIQVVVAYGEVLGGLALLAGVFTRWAAAGMVLIQLAAASLAFSIPLLSITKTGGAEYNLVLAATCFAVILLGPGHFSVDWLRDWFVKEAPEVKKEAAEVKPVARPEPPQLVAAGH